jgi:hypothetical protein
MGRSPNWRAVVIAALTGFLWGLAEATVFFVVPDVLLCFWAMRSAREAFASTVAVVVGAMLGAAILYLCLGLDGANYTVLHNMWASLPGFRVKMTEVAAAHLSAHGAAGLLAGPASGIPYRIYVGEAWRLHLPLADVLLWTPVARLERIAIAPLVVLGLRFIAERVLAPRFRRVPWYWALAALIVIYWIAIDVWYWAVLVPTQYG